jgi:CBS domain-containing protein
MTGLVGEVMTRTVVVAPEDAPFKELVRRMHEHRVSALPIVTEDGRLVGIVSEADLIAKRDPDLWDWHLLEGPHRRADRRKALGVVAAEVMTAPAITVGPEAPIAEAAHLLRERRLKHLPVVAPDGRLVGMISRVDVLASYLRSDAAIEEEVDAFLARAIEDPATVRTEVRDGVVRLDGLVELRTIARRLVDRLRLIDGVVAVDADGLEWEVDDTIEPVSSVPWVGF